MSQQVLDFIIVCFCFLTISRTLLCLWHWQRVKKAGGLWAVLKRGLRIDTTLIAMIAGLPLMLSPWLGHFQLAGQVSTVWFLFAWFLIVLLEASTPQFIFEYDTRPNRLYVEYLKRPKEVFGMLWKGYKTAISGTVILIALCMWVGYLTFGQYQVDQPFLLWQKLVFTLLAIPLIFLSIRGTLGHRPINPATVAYCGDGMLNTLPLNSLYSVLYAIYSIKNERSPSAVYGNLEAEQISHEVNCHAGIVATNQAIPSLHIQEPSCNRVRPLNLVIIVEESLGAQFVHGLGGKGLTPCLDELLQQGWCFTQAYATGTRSVRGLEALVAGFPPTISDAVLRLSGAQKKFFTLAQALKQHNYKSRFLYGGEADFDNMKSFFLGNGFDELYDRPSFKKPNFVGTWGVSDEDMFHKLDSLLSEKTKQPTFTLAFSVSNHSPWEYPQGRIKVNGNPATSENAVRYADWALGDFFSKAKNSHYWEDTVFLVVADHDSRVFGANLIPLKHFHIPALILGADVKPFKDNRIISQIDLPTTLLSLIGVKCEHPMIGHDLTKSDCNRAMMQYGENYGYLRGDKLIVLEPHRQATQYLYSAPDNYQPVAVDSALFKEALSHVLWPAWVYKNNYYTDSPRLS